MFFFIFFILFIYFLVCVGGELWPLDGGSLQGLITEMSLC